MLPLGLEGHEVEFDTVGVTLTQKISAWIPNLLKPSMSLVKVPSFLITTTETHIYKCHNWALLKNPFLSSEH